MTDPLVVWEQAAVIYLPMVAVGVAAVMRRRQPRRFAACLLGVLWIMPSLLALQMGNLYAGWWDFRSGSAGSLRGMPLEMFAGWVVLWGVFPQIALAGIGNIGSAALMIALDCLMMPVFSATIHLHAHWLRGEAVAAVLVLLPALCIGEWTRLHTHLRLRALVQVVTGALLFLFFFPEIAFAMRAYSPRWQPLFSMTPALRTMALQAIFLLAVPGISAAFEFAERGGGTPIPYDPPVRLVTSGIYRYCANPMQLFCFLVMLAWAALLRNPWLCVAAALSLIYSAGIAEWDEREDLASRFGQPWRDYRAQVRNWRLRWRPYHSGAPATLYVARQCGPCSEVRMWIGRRTPVGLRIVDAETLPAGSIRRMRYDPCDGSDVVDGVRAMGRALEHLHLGWAFCGCMLRLPGVWQLAQLVLDASGLGPRNIQADCVRTEELPS